MVSIDKFEENLLPHSEGDDAIDYNYDDEYAFGEDVVENIPIIKHDIRPRINQGMNKNSKSACTIFGAWAQLIRLFGLDLSREEANKVGLSIIDYCVKEGGYVIGQGWGTPMAIKYVTEWWNTIGYKQYKKCKVSYLRILWNNPLVKEALDKGHMVGYTKTIQWAGDQINGYVNKKAEEYRQMTGHRLNLKGPDYIPVATGGAKKGDAKWGCQDNYFEQIGTNFYIEDLGEYVNKGVYAYVYIILPEDAMYLDIEETKERIEEEKAVNAIIATLTTTWGSVPEWIQNKNAEFAKELRGEYDDAMPIIGDETKKSATAMVNMLSFNYKFMPQKYQEKFALLAKELREDFNIEK